MFEHVRTVNNKFGSNYYFYWILLRIQIAHNNSLENYTVPLCCNNILHKLCYSYSRRQMETKTVKIMNIQTSIWLILPLSLNHSKCS